MDSRETVEHTGATTSEEEPLIGRHAPGYVEPVINERAVRVGAGILFMLGIIAYVRAIMD